MRRTTAFAFALALVSACFLTVWAGGVEGRWEAIRRVADGDTLELVDGRLVRLIGVNAPEIDHEARTAEPLALEAREFLAAAVSGGGIRLESDVEKKDHHGRTLAWVFLPDGRLLNELLLREGLAYCLPTVPNLKYEGRLLAAQRAAMAEEKGIWKDLREKPSARYTGNLRSRRFHLATCPDARRIAPRNRVSFASLREAFFAGFAPDRECLPAEKKPF